MAAELGATQESIKYQNSLEEIYSLIKGRAPIIWVLTHEENRFIATFNEVVCNPLNREVWLWSLYQGLVKLDQRHSVERASGEQKETWIPGKALQRICDLTIRPDDKDKIKGHCFLMRDFHTVLDANITRQLRDIYYYLMASGKTLIVVSPVLAHGPGGSQAGLPITLEKQISVVRFELPKKEEINTQINNILTSIKNSPRMPKTKTQVDYSDQELSEFTRAVQGLTEEEINTSVSTNITYLHRIDVNKLIYDKRQIIRKSEILEFIDTPTSLKDVGGMDQLKQYLTKYTNAYSDEAKEFGVEPLRGIILSGPPGCLSGNTVIGYNRGNRPGIRYLTLENLYKKFNHIYKNWDETIPTYFYSYDQDQRIIMNRVLGITEAGLKPVITVQTIEGQQITLTADHPICTITGEFISAGELKENQEILIQGSMKPVKGKGRDILNRPKRKIIETLKYHPYGNIHIVNGCTYKRVAYARLLVEAHMNKIPIELFIKLLKTDPSASKLKFLDPKYDVHHIDEHPMNDILSNLMVLEHDEHAKEHGKIENFHVEYLQTAHVMSINESGKEMTYDIQMDYPYNNFIANDFIVHNTGKSLLCKAIGKLWKLPLLKLDIGKIMGSLVGQSENRMRQVIDQAQSMAPVILYIDEIEKSLSGTKSSNFSDGGTLARVFGTLLTAMQEGLEGVTIVASANDITMLPPELIRRFNEVFFIDLPSPDERWEIFSIHLNKRHRNIKDFESRKVDLLAASDNFTGAEIEKAIKDAIAAAFCNKSKELTIDLLINTLQDTKPIAKVMKDKIDKLRDAAKGQYRYASSYIAPIQVKTSSGKKLDVAESVKNMKEFVKGKKKTPQVEVSPEDRFSDIVNENEKEKN